MAKANVSFAERLRSATLVDVLSYVFPLVSAVTTYSGLRQLTGSILWGVLAAIVAFLFVAAFYRSYLKWYPTASAKNRQKLFLPMIIFGVFAICLTTPFSVTAFGGNTALRKDFEGTISQAATRTDERLGSLYGEQSLAGSLDQYAQEFSSLSKQEEAGAFTGTAGRGSAAVTFDSVSKSLITMRDQVNDNKEKVDGLKIEAKNIIDDLRGISYSHTNQQEKVTQFAARLSDLNDLFAKMDAASVVPAVAQSANSLNLVAQLQTGDAGSTLGVRQSQAIAKAQDLVRSAQRDIRLAAAKQQRATAAKLAPLSVMDEGQAIFAYAGTILWAYALALALDFSPLLFLYMLAIFNDIDKTSKKAQPEEEGVYTLRPHERVK